MRLSPLRFLAEGGLRSIRIGLLAAFVFYTSGAALLAHHQLAHGHGLDASQAATTCASGHDHGHDQPAPETPNSPVDEDCLQCDILAGSDPNALVACGSTPLLELAENGPHTSTETRPHDTGLLHSCISRRGPPSEA